MTDILDLHSFDEPIIVRGVVHLDELIEELENRKPFKDPKNLRIWRHDMNILIQTVNRLAGFKRYNLKK